MSGPGARTQDEMDRAVRDLLREAEEFGMLYGQRATFGLSEMPPGRIYGYALGAMLLGPAQIEALYGNPVGKAGSSRLEQAARRVIERFRVQDVEGVEEALAELEAALPESE